MCGKNSTSVVEGIVHGRKYSWIFNINIYLGTSHKMPDKNYVHLLIILISTLQVGSVGPA